MIIFLIRLFNRDKCKVIHESNFILTAAFIPLILSTGLPNPLAENQLIGAKFISSLMMHGL